MGAARVVKGGDVQRAKSLRLEDSRFRVGHAQESAAGTSSAKVSEIAAVQVHRLRSPERIAVRTEVVSIVCVAAHDMAHPDLGAAINEPPETVRRIRAGALPLTVDHLLRLARRRPEMFDEIVSQMRGKQ